METSSAPTESGGNSWRALAVILAILLLVGSFIIIAAMVDIAGTPTCHDVRLGLAAPSGNSCFDGSSFQKTIAVILGFAGGGVAVIAMISAIAFTITSRRGRLVAVLAVAALALTGISILVGSV
jgi:hypothetical protein